MTYPHRQKHAVPLAILLLLFANPALSGMFAQSAIQVAADASSITIRRMVTQGLARRVTENLFTCAVTLANYRASPVGTITADDGTVLTVPAATAYQTGPKLADLFNECNRTTPAKLAVVKLDNVPVVEIDPDGEVITGYIIADNYFELCGNDWHAGDGGLVARFSDGTATDGSWKAQAFYIAPLAHPDDVLEKGNVHETAKLGRVYPGAKVPGCRERCFAVHYPLPKNWAAPNFDDADWPRAYEFTDAEVGVDHLPAFTRYPEAFAGARWIWSYNLVFDNLVLARKTVR
jgi:hypothetical protein